MNDPKASAPDSAPAKVVLPSKKEGGGRSADLPAAASPLGAPETMPGKRPWWKFWGGKASLADQAPASSKISRSSASAIDPSKVAAKSNAHAKSQPEPKKAVAPKPKPKPVIPPVAKPKGRVVYDSSLDILPPIPVETLVVESQEAVLTAIENGQGDVLKAISGGNDKLTEGLNKVSSDLAKSQLEATTTGKEIKASITQVDGSLGELRKANEKSLGSLDKMNSAIGTVESGVQKVQSEVAKSNKAYDELVKKTEKAAEQREADLAQLQKRSNFINILLGLGLVAVIIAYIVTK